MATLAEERDRAEDSPMTALADLPALPAAHRGESAAAAESDDGASFAVTVANAGEASGYLCSVRADATLPGLHPGAVYSIFTHPRNDGIFSGIKRVRDRRVLEEQEEEGEGEAAGAAPARGRRGGERVGKAPAASSSSSPSASASAAAAPPRAIAYRRVEVEQVGELKLLMARREFATRLVVEEDARGAPGLYATRFSLLSSDALARFEGSWTIEAAPEDAGKVATTAAAMTTTTTTTINNKPRRGCRVRLEQQVLPRGVPVFLQRVPVLGALLRRVSLAAVERLMRDLQAAARALREADPAAASSGDERRVHAALDGIQRARRLDEQLRGGGDGAAAVASFAPVGGEDEDEDEEDEEEDGDEDERDGGGARAAALRERGSG